jgi:hypothetical protein
MGPISAKPIAPYEDADAYEIFAMLLPTGYSWIDESNKQTVILAETGAYCLQVLAEVLPTAIMDELQADYVRRTQTTWILQRRFHLNKPYGLVSYRRISNLKDFALLAKDYPGSTGYVEFSPYSVPQKLDR